MTRTVEIGTFHERDARIITRCPSYYAADTETIRTAPGDYPARVTFEGGYTVPMPYWLLVRVDAVRVDGRLYSGAGGYNFAHTDLTPGESAPLHIQAYAHDVRRMVADGVLTLAPEYAWLATEHAWQHADAPKTWEDVAHV